MERLNYEAVCDEIRDMLLQKNGIDETYKSYGMVSHLVRISDKVNQLHAMMNDMSGEVSNETIQAVLKDLAICAICATAQITADKPSHMEMFARTELDKMLEQAASEGGDSYSMQYVFNKNVFDVVKTFIQGEHSGYSASLAIKAIDRLLRYQPLTHLTFEDDEWAEISKGVYQNRRASNVFKDETKYDGKPYCLDGPDGKPVLLEEYPYAYWGIFTQPKKEEED